MHKDTHLHTPISYVLLPLLILFWHLMRQRRGRRPSMHTWWPASILFLKLWNPLGFLKGMVIFVGPWSPPEGLHFRAFTSSTRSLWWYNKPTPLPSYVHLRQLKCCYDYYYYYYYYYSTRLLSPMQEVAANTHDNIMTDEWVILSA